VLPRPQLIFPSKIWGFWNLFEFSAAEITFKSISPTFWIQTLPNKFHSILLIKFFPTTPKAHSNSFEIFNYDLIFFLVKKSFNIQELLHCKSRHHGTTPMHPSLLRAFQRHQEHDLKHPSTVDLITTKQNKLPCFIGRLLAFIINLTLWTCIAQESTVAETNLGGLVKRA